jgi:selenocysteine-specific elongation factor
MVHGEEKLLADRLDGLPPSALSALLITAGWTGVPENGLPERTGLSPATAGEAVESLRRSGGLVSVEGRLFAGEIWGRSVAKILQAVQDFHAASPLRSGMPLEEVRQAMPGKFGPKLAEAALQHLEASGDLNLRKGVATLSTFRPRLTPAQQETRAQLQAKLRESGLAPPGLRELAEDLGPEEELQSILRLMESEGVVVSLEKDLFFAAEAVTNAGESVIARLSGKKDLGPADFREVLPVTRKHLLPLLRYFDLTGITTRIGDGRDVASEIPAGWGTPRSPM